MGHFSEELQQVQNRINHFLEAQFEGIESHNAPLLDAMKYALLLGGKRVRPFWFTQQVKCLVQRNNP